MRVALPLLRLLLVGTISLGRMGHAFVMKRWIACPPNNKNGPTVRPTTALPVALTAAQLQELQTKQILVVPEFIPSALQDQLRKDIYHLRQLKRFQIAKIGQDSTNRLNTDIRVAETCFLGDSVKDVPNVSREKLYQTLDDARKDMMEGLGIALDQRLTELLYAYYPQGGFYRQHLDAIPNSASTLRKYSLLLYLNPPDWDCSKDGGALRLYINDDDDDNQTTIDVNPAGGTLVLFQSEAIPHEVLDTNRERMAVVGWYNRPVQLSDAVELSESPVRLLMLAAAAGLVAVGISNANP